MANEADIHAAEEYVRLWKEVGLDTTHLESTRLKARLGARKTSADAAPVTLNNLEDVRKWLGDCRRCGLCAGRANIVFGTGTAQTELMFVGEGPGADEDAQGQPFVGKAGGLLTKIIEAMGLTREKVYIANIVKCRPPNNRVPAPEEVAACLPFLKAQVDLIRPKWIVALGLTASTNLTGSLSTMGNLRGRFHALKWNPEILVMPTYHPAYLLRNPEAKKIVWDDIKIVLNAMGKKETL